MSHTIDIKDKRVRSVESDRAGDMIPDESGPDESDQDDFVSNLHTQPDQTQTLNSKQPARYCNEAIRTTKMQTASTLADPRPSRPIE